MCFVRILWNSWFVFEKFLKKRAVLVDEAMASKNTGTAEP
jgi:hypothetical protein